MWNQPSDPRIVTSLQRRPWFPAPFGVAEVVPRLEEWKKTNPKRIDDTWRHEHASNLLDDYMAEIKNFVKKKWSAKTFADDADEKCLCRSRCRPGLLLVRP